MIELTSLALGKAWALLACTPCLAHAVRGSSRSSTTGSTLVRGSKCRGRGSIQVPLLPSHHRVVTECEGTFVITSQVTTINALVLPVPSTDEVGCTVQHRLVVVNDWSNRVNNVLDDRLILLRRSIEEECHLVARGTVGHIGTEVSNPSTRLLDERLKGSKGHLLLEQESQGNASIQWTTQVIVTELVTLVASTMLLGVGSVHRESATPEFKLVVQPRDVHLQGVDVPW